MLEQALKFLLLILTALISFLAQNYWFRYMILDKYFDNEDRTSKSQYIFYKNILTFAFCTLQLLIIQAIFNFKFVIDLHLFSSSWVSIVIQVVLLYIYISFYNKNVVSLLIMAVGLEFFFEGIIRNNYASGNVQLDILLLLLLILISRYIKSNQTKWFNKKYSILYSLIFCFFWLAIVLTSSANLQKSKIITLLFLYWGVTWLLSETLFIINKNVSQHILEYNKRLRSGSIDALTNIANRGSFEENLIKSFNFYTKVSAPYSLAIFDIDHFKKVNDKWGHLAGDEVLKKVADTAESILYSYFKNSKIYRVGGEEFVIAFRGKTVEESVPVLLEIADKIREQVIYYKDTKIQVTISAGITQMTKKCKDGKELYERADEYMYNSKRNGRNKITCEGKIL